MVRTPPSCAPTTTLTVSDEDLDFQPSQPWRKPFEQLLILLWIIPCPDAEEIQHQSFCFQHAHDLSKLSTTFLSVYISPGIRYKIYLDDIMFDDPDPGSYSGQVFVAELEEYANRVLSRVRVSVFVHTCTKPLTKHPKSRTTGTY